jgi:histidinol-phosphate aminotransferase
VSPFPRGLLDPLRRYAPDRRPVEVDLSDNTNRWGTHPAALRAIQGAASDDLSRYPSVYGDRLRETIADRFGVPMDAVVTGCGSDDLLDSTFRGCCDPGDVVSAIFPTFAMVEIFARLNGLPVERWEGTRSAGGHGTPPLGWVLPDPQELLARKSGLLYLCRPNNPTGEVIPRSWLEEVLDRSGARTGDTVRGGPVVLLDEAYADFLEGEDPDHFLRIAARSRRLVVLRTLSKAYGLAGLRVGFAVGAPEVIREIEKARGPYKVTRVSEAAAVAALQDVEGWIPRIRGETLQERKRLASELETRGFRVLPSGANFLCLPLQAGPDSGLTAESLTARLRAEGVAVRPFPGLPGLGDAVRVSVGPRLEMDRFLRALDGIQT